MSRSGGMYYEQSVVPETVLIPLLVDVPLWVLLEEPKFGYILVLITLLVDVPLWESNKRYY